MLEACCLKVTINISCLKGWKFIARHRIEFIHASPCPKHVYSDLQYPSPYEACQQFIFWEKSICCQHATRRTTNEIWITIMIIAWWYSNKFLSLPIILFPFYSILFTCLSVSLCGDYLPAGDSVSFILFYLLAFHCLHAVIICLPDMDRMSVLVLPGRYW